MFGWFKRKERRPSDVELSRRIFSALHGLIATEGFEEFSHDRLSLIVTEDFDVSISADERFLRANLWSRSR
jgi:hypothetical protein